jgi:hypothetical protein
MSCGCTISVDLVPGNDCGIEFAGGVAYAIGDQTVGHVLTDDCHCVTQVYVNGEEDSSFVNDGDPIEVTIDAPACNLCGMSVECQGSFASFRNSGPTLQGVWRKDDKVRLMLNPRKVREVLVVRQAHRRNLRGTES